LPGQTHENLPRRNNNHFILIAKIKTNSYICSRKRITFLMGSIVYNTNSTTITGLYLWDGEYWLRINTKGSTIGSNLTFPESFGGTLHEPVLFLPAGSWRDFNDGGVYLTGNNGSYWSSTVGSSDAHYLDFDSSYMGADASTRANGLSVRCIAE
jgi:hypothetical protein